MNACHVNTAIYYIVGSMLDQRRRRLRNIKLGQCENKFLQ